MRTRIGTGSRVGIIRRNFRTVMDICHRVKMTRSQTIEIDDDCFRLTEIGDYRITEDGDFRILQDCPSDPVTGSDGFDYGLDFPLA